MAQLPIEFGMDARANEAWRSLLAALRDAVDAVGFKEACCRLDVQPSVLSEALADRDKRHVQARWLPTLLLLAPDHHRTAILGALAGVCGYELVKRKVLTAEERLERLEQALRAKLGKVGAELIAEVGQ